MKKAIFLPIIFLIISSTVYAQNFRGETKKDISICPPEKKLKIGETLEYSVQWLGINVGKVILKVDGLQDVGGYQCYHIRAQAFPNDFFKKLYDVEYRADSYIDIQSFDGRRFERTKRINKEFSHTIIDFDRVKNEATYNEIEPRKETVTAQILPGTQNLLFLLYYFRFHNIQSNSTYSINIYYDKKNWSVETKIGEPFLKEIYKKGVFPVVKVSLDSDLNNYIFGRHQLVVLATTDCRRIPLEFQFPTALGPVVAKIRNIPQ